MSTTTLTIRDVLLKDPARPIPNEGVSKVGRPRDAVQWDVLRFELDNFVSEGAYEDGLERILSRFLANQSKGDQPGAWVSGFFGSGKSHFTRVLDALWSDLALPDETRARGLVHNLSDEIKAHLTELNTRGRQGGGLWSASGTLSSGAQSFRMAVLGILLQAADLPSQYGPGTFMLWLRRKGYESAVRAALADKGLDLEREVLDLYVSTDLGEALIALDPGLGSTPEAVLDKLAIQFAPKDDITDDELVSLARDILASVSTDSNPDWSKRKLPATLIVLDEVQQYIGDRGDRSLEVQTAVQNLQNQLEGQAMVVATGQSALQDTPHLQKLQDRFGIKVQLRSTDVDEVVRKVILEKRPEAVPVLDSVLTAASGEIHRHLQGTAIAVRGEDDKTLLADYPLLPTRRRFWEAVLRAVDPSGRGGQLRSQLQLTHEATGKVATSPLGAVIPGDAIFDRLRDSMISSGVLLSEIDEAIQSQLESGRPDASLRARVMALVFLIGQLPTTGIEPTGVQATPTIIADLLVEDLRANSGKLRDAVATTLQALADEGRLMLVDGQYRLTTREGQEWDADYRSRQIAIRGDDARIASDRAEELKKALNARLKGVSVLQGETKTKRDFMLHFGPEPPPQTGAIPVWVRDEWTVTDKTVREDAQREGVDSAIIHLLLPRRNADELRSALASFAGAQETIGTRPQPSSAEGIEARAGMQGRLEKERSRLDGYLREVLDHARIYQGGGTEVTGQTLTESLQIALSASARRLFSRFDEADRKGWDKVVDRAVEGNANPLQAIGHDGEVTAHPVPREIHAYLAGVARSGSQIRKRFAESPYGWPQDAIDGGLLALVVDGQVRPSLNGKPRPVRELIRMQIGPTEFARESNPPTMLQRLAVRKLFADTLSTAAKGDDNQLAQKFVDELSSLAQAAGGPAPRPAIPQPELLETLRLQQGGDRVITIAERGDQLWQWWTAWEQAGKKLPAREKRWARAQSLLSHAAGLPQREEIARQLEAIHHNRLLLHDPDPLDAPLDELVNGLRDAIRERRDQLLAARQAVIAELEASPEWKKLKDDVWQEILSANGLGPVPGVDVGDDAAIIAELEQRPLATWADRTAALPVRAAAAHAAAVKLTQPEAGEVKPKMATLATPDDVDAYLDELRAEIMALIDAGRSAIITR